MLQAHQAIAQPGLDRLRLDRAATAGGVHAGHTLENESAGVPRALMRQSAKEGQMADSRWMCCESAERFKRLEPSRKCVLGAAARSDLGAG